jgi:ABC-type transport system involved in multi-copper enzyme maturation permease subunit
MLCFVEERVLAGESYISQVGIIIMSASFFGQEYFDSSLRTTFLANSSRTKVFVAKLSLLAAMSISTGLISSSLGIVVAMYHDVYFTSYVLYRAIFALFSWVMLGWISGFIAIILKSHVISMSIIIPLFLAVNQLLVAITRIFRFLPDAATRNVFTVYQNEAFLETRTGIAVQFIWVIVMGMFALWLYSHRDVK